MKFAVLTKEFTVNGVTFKKGTRFHLYDGNMFEDGCGFNKEGRFCKPNHFGYGKYLYIPAEYFDKEKVAKYLCETFRMEKEEAKKILEKQLKGIDLDCRYSIIEKTKAILERKKENAKRFHLPTTMRRTSLC